MYPVLIITLGALALAIGHHIREGEWLRDEELLRTCGLEGLGAEFKEVLGSHDYVVVAVGDGMPEDSPPLDRTYSTQYAQGYDLYQGISHAYGQANEEVADLVGILYVDDGGGPKCSRLAAQEIASHPEVLAVIGHSTSATTMAGLETFSLTNIPILMPAATSPALLSKPRANLFRLPSNDRIQALAIADLVADENKIAAKSVIIVWDRSPEARVYSEYLKIEITNLIQNSMSAVPVVIEETFPVELDPVSYNPVFRRIASSSVDAVVFLGYGTVARDFLLGLEHEFRAAVEGKGLPKIILSDGCKVPDIADYDMFDVLLTFPSAPISECKYMNSFHPGAKYSRFQKMYLEESYEILGYDSAAMVFEAIDRSMSEISRIRLAERIHSAAAETCNEYDFRDSENILHRYYVYSANEDRVVYRYDDEVRLSSRMCS